MVTGVRQRGFTATEILVVITIIGILAAFAFPAMTKLLTTQAVRTSAYDLMADLTYARSEAMGRQTDITIRGVAGTDWKQGWTIAPAAGGEALRTQKASGSAIVLRASAESVTFDLSGHADAAGLTFSILPVDPDATDMQKRCVRIDPMGRPRATEGDCP